MELGVKGISSRMGMGEKYVLRETREGKKNTLPEKPEVQNKDWLGEEALFHTQEFIVSFIYLFILTEEIT